MTDVPTFTIITNQLHVGRYTVFASPMDPTGIPSFLANLFGVFVLYLGSNPGRWTCGFRWALFGKALPKKFAEKHLAFAEVSKRMSRKTCEDVDLYNSKKKNSWLQLVAKNQWSSRGGMISVFLSLFQNDTQFPLPEILGISLRPPRIFFLPAWVIGYTPWDSQPYKSFVSDIHLYKQRLLEKSKPCCAFAFTVNAKTIIPQKKNRGKTVNEKK